MPRCSDTHFGSISSVRFSFSAQSMATIACGVSSVTSDIEAMTCTAACGASASAARAGAFSASATGMGLRLLEWGMGNGEWERAREGGLVSCSSGACTGLVSCSSGAGIALGASLICGVWCLPKFDTCKYRIPPASYRMTKPRPARSSRSASTSASSYGRISALIFRGLSSNRPSRSERHQRPENRMRPSGDTSASTSFVKKPGFNSRALAIIPRPSAICRETSHGTHRREQ